MNRAHYRAIKMYLHSSIIPYPCCALRGLNKNISAETPPSFARQQENASKPTPPSAHKYKPLGDLGGERQERKKGPAWHFGPAKSKNVIYVSGEGSSTEWFPSSAVLPIGARLWLSKPRNMGWDGALLDFSPGITRITFPSFGKCRLSPGLRGEHQDLSSRSSDAGGDPEPPTALGRSSETSKVHKCEVDQ